MVKSPPILFSTGGSITRTNRLSASTRPAQAAAIVAVAGRPVTFQIAARSIMPPSRGRPGSRLKTPITRLAHMSWKTSVEATVSAEETTRVRP